MTSEQAEAVRRYGACGTYAERRDVAERYGMSLRLLNALWLAFNRR
jgi:hypothetical protein